MSLNLAVHFPYIGFFAKSLVWPKLLYFLAAPARLERATYCLEGRFRGFTRLLIVRSIHRFANVYSVLDDFSLSSYIQPNPVQIRSEPYIFRTFRRLMGAAVRGAGDSFTLLLFTWKHTEKFSWGTYGEDQH